QWGGMPVGIERSLDLVEQRRQRIVERIANSDRLRPGKNDRYRPSFRADDRVAGVVFLDELPGTFDAGRIDDGVQKIRAQIRRVGAHRLLESLVDRQHAAVGQEGILAYKEPDQMKQVPQR